MAHYSEATLQPPSLICRLLVGIVRHVRDGVNLDDGYYQREIKVVDRQMALAGLRLAKLLNETIGNMTPRDFR